MKKLTVIHTTLATASMIGSMIEEMYPDCFEIINIMDDSLLNDIKIEGKLTKSVIERFVQYTCIAQHNGSDAILLACSSIGKAADAARNLLTIPLFKIDEPMAEEAVQKGNRILVLGTVKSTLEPTSELIEDKKISAEQQVRSYFIPDTFELLKKDRDQHDKKIADVIEKNIDDYDAVVLAQASMVNALTKLKRKDAQHKILTSLPLGLFPLKQIL